MLSLINFAHRTDDGSLAFVRMAKQKIKRTLFRIDQKMINNYFESASVRKLQIGCGFHLLEDWLNTDYLPVNYEAIMLDATKSFPFPDNSFDYIYSEHMIEHISFTNGLYMLAECFRIMKPGGTIRIATPDFQFLIDLYQNNQSLSPIQDKYLSWMRDWMNQRTVNSAPYKGSIFIINNFVRDWGHEFIYDEASLAFALENAGFAHVKRTALNDSEHESLRNLTNDKRVPDGFVKLETLVLEATKN